MFYIEKHLNLSKNQNIDCKYVSKQSFTLFFFLFTIVFHGFNKGSSAPNLQLLWDTHITYLCICKNAVLELCGPKNEFIKRSYTYAFSWDQQPTKFSKISLTYGPVYLKRANKFQEHPLLLCAALKAYFTKDSDQCFKSIISQNKL